MPSTRRLLDNQDRIGEALFGLIMVLTFTCSISAAEAGREDVRTMLFGALGCNLAWGIIDAVMYLMAALSERSRGIDTLRAVRGADAQAGQRIIAGALPPVLASALQPAELERARERLIALPELPPRPRLGVREWLGAAGVFLWVFGITFPVVIPFLFIAEVVPALRVSNAIAIVLLFAAGYSFGRSTGLRPWSTGIVMVILGGVLVAVAIALGG